MISLECRKLLLQSHDFLFRSLRTPLGCITRCGETLVRVLEFVGTSSQRLDLLQRCGGSIHELLVRCARLLCLRLRLVAPLLPLVHRLRCRGTNLLLPRHDFLRLVCTLLRLRRRLLGVCKFALVPVNAPLVLIFEQKCRVHVTPTGRCCGISLTCGVTGEHSDGESLRLRRRGSRLCERHRSVVRLREFEFVEECVPFHLQRLELFLDGRRCCSLDDLFRVVSSVFHRLVHFRDDELKSLRLRLELSFRLLRVPELSFDGRELQRCDGVNVRLGGVHYGRLRDSPSSCIITLNQRVNTLTYYRLSHRCP